MSPAAESPPSRLSGWKDIANYFHKGVRTVQRWEKELGLPVHRLNTGKGEIVFALTAELDAWSTRIEHQHLGRITGEEAGVRGAEGRDEERDGTARSRRGRRFWLFGGAGLLALLVAGIVLAPMVRTGPASVGAEPHHWTVENNELRIFSAAGQPLWARTFDFPLTEQLYRNLAAAGRQPVLIEDLDGNGKREVLFLSEPASGSPTRGLYCFNSDGTLRFRHQPAKTVRYGDVDYAAPWRAGVVAVTRNAAGSAAIWFASMHRTWFPTVLEKLTPQGQVVGEYWSDGQILTVLGATLHGRKVVLVGACNNETKGASLAVLDEGRPTGSAPARRAEYQCRNCPPGMPLAFSIFPRLEVAEAVGAIATVDHILTDHEDQITVRVQQLSLSGADHLDLNAHVYYLVNADMRVTHAELGSDVPIARRQLELVGRLSQHSARSDALQLFPIWRWVGATLERVDQPEGLLAEHRQTALAARPTSVRLVASGHRGSETRER